MCSFSVSTLEVCRHCILGIPIHEIVFIFHPFFITTIHPNVRNSCFIIIYFYSLVNTMYAITSQDENSCFDISEL